MGVIVPVIPSPSGVALPFWSLVVSAVYGGFPTQTWWPIRESTSFPCGGSGSLTPSWVKLMTYKIHIQSGLPMGWHYKVAMSVHCHKSVPILKSSQMLPGCKPPMNKQTGNFLYTFGVGFCSLGADVWSMVISHVHLFRIPWFRCLFFIALHIIAPFIGWFHYVILQCLM